jgi:hypothetical protein
LFIVLIPEDSIPYEKADLLMRLSIGFLKFWLIAAGDAMKENFYYTSLICFFLFLACGLNAMELRSPDDRIVLRTEVTDGKVFYSVDFQGKPVIAKSRLGIELAGGAFGGSLELQDSEIRTVDETWQPVWGQFSEYRNQFRELTMDLAETGAVPRTMQVILRAYNDGVAFRYVFPKQENLSEVHYQNEFSSVKVVSDEPVVWYPKSDTALFSEQKLETVNKACRTPFTIRLSDDCYISLHEAGVVQSSDAELRLGQDKRTLTYASNSKQAGPAVSPWRSIQIVRQPGELIVSPLILNLNEPNTLEDTSWINPGVSLWDWRNHGGVADDGFVYGLNTESYIRYIDFAHEQGLDFVLIDAEWYGPEHKPSTDPTTFIEAVDMPKVARYAKKKGVGIWLYINDKALRNFDLDRTFALYQKWGIVGIKHGFLNGGNQEKTEFSIKVLNKAAEYQLMYNLHEPNKPTGLSRTYPHYMSSEYVNCMLDGPSRPAVTPGELSVFPVVHNLGGPVDRSSGMFDMDQSLSRDKVHKQIPGTVVSQVAQCLVFFSGIQVLPDLPDAYRRKSDLFEYIKQLPMTWDETRVLEMDIGKHISIARRSRDTWFIAALANESGRELELSLDFLEPGLIYKATLYEDADGSHYRFAGPASRVEANKMNAPFEPVKTNREIYHVKQLKVNANDAIKARIAPGGGFCMLIRPTEGLSSKHHQPDKK